MKLAYININKLNSFTILTLILLLVNAFEKRCVLIRVQSSMMGDTFLKKI